MNKRPYFQKPQQGFALVIVVLVIIVIAISASFLARSIGSQSDLASNQLQASRAYFAARSGIDIASRMIDSCDTRHNNHGGNFCGNSANEFCASLDPLAPDTVTLTIDTQPTNTSSQTTEVTVTCYHEDVPEGFAIVGIYNLVSTVTLGDNATQFHAERQIRAAYVKGSGMAD